MRGDYDKNEINEINQEDSNINIISNENNLNQTKNISLQELKLDYNDNTILILGSEGFGVSKDLISSFVNYNVYIPPRLDISKINEHPFDLIDSLNVGVSAGIIINNIITQLKSGENQKNDLKNIGIEENNNIKIQFW